MRTSEMQKTYYHERSCPVTRAGRVVAPHHCFHCFHFRIAVLYTYIEGGDTSSLGPYIGSDKLVFHFYL
jgi:hypothetical protein